MAAGKEAALSPRGRCLPGSTSGPGRPAQREGSPPGLANGLRPPGSANGPAHPENGPPCPPGSAGGPDPGQRRLGSAGGPRQPAQREGSPPGPADGLCPPGSANAQPAWLRAPCPPGSANGPAHPANGARALRALLAPRPRPAPAGSAGGPQRPVWREGSPPGRRPVPSRLC
ncbi:cuticle collagen 2C-like [Marmota flaviventris]|uniref:cuticle collagen 2C-like n=1 Tax=Marmota flaviventris TaxID=93162 RepID=UPI003A864EC5